MVPGPQTAVLWGPMTKVPAPLPFHCFPAHSLSAAKTSGCKELLPWGWDVFAPFQFTLISILPGEEKGKGRHSHRCISLQQHSQCLQFLSLHRAFPAGCPGQQGEMERRKQVLSPGSLLPSPGQLACWRVTQGHSPAPQGCLRGPLSAPHPQPLAPGIPEHSRSHRGLLPEEFPKMSNSWTRGNGGRSEIS